MSPGAPVYDVVRVGRVNDSGKYKSRVCARGFAATTSSWRAWGRRSTADASAKPSARRRKGPRRSTPSKRWPGR
eukprot:6359455-Alexandrium_andersonii.AAC.1